MTLTSSRQDATTPAPATTHAGDGLTAASGVAALLALAVTVIHVLDQGGLTALKDPAYIGYGYYALEIAGVVGAVWLLLRRSAAAAWLLALGVGLGPLLGYVVSRSVGLPRFTEDIGNWTEPIGVASLVVEGLLIVLAASVLARLRRAQAR